MGCDLPSVFSVERRTARRKEHNCCECQRTITIDEQYQLCKGIWEGKARRFKTCIPCADLRDVAYREAQYPEEGPALGEGELKEYAKEAGIDWPPCS